jgi:ionotropic glutamate receptor
MKIKYQDKRIDAGSLPKPLISSAFYYDLAKVGVLAMKSALEAGEWKRPRFLNCDFYDENMSATPRNIDLRRRLQQVTEAGDFNPSYAGFVWGKNGESRAKFEANAVVLQIKDSKLINEETVAKWQAGVDSPLNVSPSSALTCSALSLSLSLSLSHSLAQLFAHC